MLIDVDILENEIIEQYPNVLDILLRDNTTEKNIIWATSNYEENGILYNSDCHILLELITGDNGNIILPRVQKNKLQQQVRSKEMAEVFTPSWVCNAQLNLIDNAWFGRDDVFNTELYSSEKDNTWQPNPEQIVFPKGKTWKGYVRDVRLEVSCGEAPYITSRYDTTTGLFIPIEYRIGMLDRKLRVINENAHTKSEWLKAAQTAYKSIYGFEWQGDSLLLAREALLITFIENYMHKFGEEPLLKTIQFIAYIISWNIWQMDGLKGVVPNSCNKKANIIHELFGDYQATPVCEGCVADKILKHNGTYCLIMDWTRKDLESNSPGRKIRFIDLLKKQGK
ncbi:restriction endonuclease subunit M [Mucilaginibacter sp. NFR10]|uniref:restriction endonuclease subunit M n=1 Tax=Mucilaginibacter sp. NFR10 TaxID=1566292 RepID=UPI0008715A47|nr:restriction endonuclease subunit M [Mucilaginibacter sp. NFR10]SCW38368.1 hypothetical protein SAMN03159284_00135 [Mucilaginibacter sp. NFR10]